MVDIVKFLQKIKVSYEAAIENGGASAVQSEIRSSRIIGNLHEWVKESFVECGVNPNKIFPKIGETRPEITLAGKYKFKSQDVMILPKPPKGEKIELGILRGQIDKVGQSLSERAISVNVRSQLSSLAKNFDTLFERTYAEATNLHERIPNLIMGELYLVPTKAYDPNAMKYRKVKFEEKLPATFIRSFAGIANRKSVNNEFTSYERVCLLIVNFEENPPRIITENDELISLGILDRNSESGKYESSISHLNFAEDLLKTYSERHGSIEDLRNGDSIFHF